MLFNISFSHFFSLSSLRSQLSINKKLISRWVSVLVQRSPLKVLNTLRRSMNKKKSQWIGIGIRFALFDRCFEYSKWNDVTNIRSSVIYMCSTNKNETVARDSIHFLLLLLFEIKKHLHEKILKMIQVFCVCWNCLEKEDDEQEKKWCVNETQSNRRSKHRISSNELKGEKNNTSTTDRWTYAEGAKVKQINTNKRAKLQQTEKPVHQNC